MSDLVKDLYHAASQRDFIAIHRHGYLHEEAAARIEALEAGLKDGEKHFRDALTAAGMVIVPREPSDLQDQAGHDAYHWFIKMTEQKQVQRRNLWQTIYRAMTEAANG